jgi:hypothetical protein
MKKKICLTFSILCVFAIAISGENGNLIVNGNMEEWDQTDGVYAPLPKHFTKGSSGDWTSRAAGRGDAGNAMRMNQPSDDNGLHRRLYTGPIRLTAGKYRFSAFFKGVGTIRWVKINSSASTSTDAGSNFIGSSSSNRVDVAADNWQEVAAEFTVGKDGDCYFHISIFKTVDENRPFLMDDFSVVPVGESAHFWTSPAIAGIAAGKHRISFSLTGKGRVKSICLVKNPGNSLPEDTVRAKSNILNGQLNAVSKTSYQAYLDIPDGFGEAGKVHVDYHRFTLGGVPDGDLAFEDAAIARFIHLKPVAIYLKNLPGVRAGTDSDEAILQSLAADDFLVCELDCSAFPSTSPALEEALLQFHGNLPQFLPTQVSIPDGRAIDWGSVFYVPAGYRVARDIPVWNIREHGAANALDYVRSVYNKEVVNKFGIPKAETVDDMYNRYGDPLDYDLRMDIIYPSGTPAGKAPLLLNFSSNSPRFYPFAPTSAAAEVVRRAIYPLGFLTSGYAFANLDHDYVPVSRNENFNYGHFDRYTLDSYHAVAYVTAALRYIHSMKDAYNLSGKIGTMGISKASYASVIAAQTDNHAMTERSANYGAVNPVQPWPGHPSTVDVAYAASGNGTRYIPETVNGATVPMITSIGKLDKFVDHWPLYPTVINALRASGNIRLDLWMEELGHTYPVGGVDFTTGLERYPLFRKFFDRFLKPEEHICPEVFYILPRENSFNVSVDGTFRTLLPDNILPEDLHGISPDDSITVRFLSSMNTATVDQFLTVTELPGNAAIGGTWRASMKNSCFRFTPSAPFEPGRSYRISVLKGAADAAGNLLQETSERTFTVAGGTGIGGLREPLLKIYPNPAGDCLYIASGNASGDRHIRITDIHGRRVPVQHAVHGDRTLKVDVSALTAGVYIINIDTSEENRHLGFIKL